MLNVIDIVQWEQLGRPVRYIGQIRYLAIYPTPINGLVAISDQPISPAHNHKIRQAQTALAPIEDVEIAADLVEAASNDGYAMPGS